MLLCIVTLFDRKFNGNNVIQSLSNKTATNQAFVVNVIQGVYPIELFHTVDNGQPSCILQFMSDVMTLQPIVAPDITCCAQHLPGSPFTVRVWPSSPCASLSIIAAISLWTAGVVSTFEIATKDLYGNLLESWDNPWHVYMTSTIPAVRTDCSRTRALGGNIQASCDSLIVF